MALVLSFCVQSVLYAVSKNCINQLHKLHKSLMLLKVCQVQKNKMVCFSVSFLFLCFLTFYSLWVCSFFVIC